MASLQDAIFERRKELISGPAPEDYASILQGKIEERIGSEQPIINEIEKQRAELPAVRAELEGKLQNVFDPWKRQALIEREIASRKGTINAMQTGLDARRGTIADTINAATEGFKSQAAREMALLDALQKEEDIRNKQAQQEFSNRMASARLSLSQQAAARTAAKQKQGTLTPFEKVQQLARKRGGDMQYNQEGGLTLSYGGQGAPLDQFSALTTIPREDVLETSLSKLDKELLERLKRIGKKKSSSSSELNVEEKIENMANNEFEEEI